MLFILSVFLAGLFGLLLLFEWGYPLAGTFLVVLAAYTLYRMDRIESRPPGPDDLPRE